MTTCVHVEYAVPPVGPVSSVVKPELVHDARKGNVELVDELGSVEDGILVAVEQNLRRRFLHEELLLQRVYSDVEEPSSGSRKLGGRGADSSGRDVQDDEGVVQQVASRLFRPPKECPNLWAKR